MLTYVCSQNQTKHISTFTVVPKLICLLDVKQYKSLTKTVINETRIE